MCKISNEQSPVVTKPPPGYCLEGWSEFGSFCYKFDTNLRSYGDAKFDCSQKGT